MALLKWSDDDEEQKQEDLFNAPQAVTSVQDSWQPAQEQAAADAEDGAAPQQENYLLSDEKAQVDNQLQQRRAQEAAQKAEMARQAEIARRQTAATNALAEQQQQQPQQQPQTKYGGGKKKNEGGLLGFVKDVGAGIQQGLGAVGDIAIQGGGLLGSIGKNDQELVRHMQSVEKVRGWLHGQKDINNNTFVGTTDVDQKAANIAAGRGTLQDFAAVGGKGLQAGIDATMFMNPVRMALPGRLTPVVTKAPNVLRQAVQSPAVRYAARDAAFYGGLQGGATTASAYGETGELDDALMSGTRDALIGGALQGSLDLGGHVVGKGVRKGFESYLPVANKSANSLRRSGELTPVNDLAEEGLTPIQRTEEAVADGVVTPQNEMQDSNLSFDTQPQAPQIDTTMPPVANDMIENQLPNPDGIVDVTNNTPLEIPNNSAPQIDTPNLAPETVRPPVADGVTLPPQVMPANTPDVPTVKSEQLQLEESRAGTSQADEAEVNQRLQQLESEQPRIDSEQDSLPEGMNDAPLPEGALTPAKVAERLMPKLDNNDDMKQRIANAVGMEKDASSPLADILRDSGTKPEQAERVMKHFNDLERQLMEYNAPQEKNQKAYAEGGVDAIDRSVGRGRSKVSREMGTTTRRLVREIDRLEGSRDKKIALMNNIQSIIGTRNANVLTSAGLLERNITQELTANMKLAVKNPIKMAKSALTNGNIIGDTAKGELSHWKDAPSLNPVDIMKYVVGNTYRTGMIPTTALANTRRGMYRDELTKWAYETLEGRSISSKEAHKLAGTAGNEMETLVNTMTGVDNGMTNRGDAMAALKSWKEYIKSGDDGDKAKFLDLVDKHSSLADQMIAGLSKEDVAKGKGLKALGNLVFPFVRTATNLMKTTVKQDLNPAAKSLVDEIRTDLRSKPENAALLLKSKLVDYGIMSGAVALASSGVLAYNDGDEVDKPRGWSISIGDDKFVPVRSTAMELPLALAGAGQQIAQDLIEGKTRPVSYYTGMVTNSLPYIDTFNQTTGAVDSFMNGEDAGYAAKSYGINMAKSFVPGSNNGVQPYLAGKNGESLNAKTVYDKDSELQWFKNAVGQAYSPAFRDTLKDSRDNAGRVRTMDNQGVITNKKINDADTKTHNNTIDELVKYGQDNGLGKGTQDMFNTYDTGKNNNFKSVQDSITFLDAVDGKPDNTKKLQNNPKLADLASQIRDGFYGETGDELLRLNGQNLKSDASVPGKSGAKNSKLPLSMQSIKNAIAQTDLPEEQGDKLWEITQQKTELYNQMKAKSLSYDQYSAAKSELEKGEIQILSNSESYKKLGSLMDNLDKNGFFKEGGIGSTKSGQTYLWNSLNALLGSKGATPAANYPETAKGWGGGGGGGKGFGATHKQGDRKNTGLKWTPVQARKMAEVKSGKYTPVQVKVKLGNAVKKDKTQNYSDRTF